MLPVQLATFAVQVLLLTLTRDKLIFELSASSLLLFSSTHPGIIIYSLITLPGTLIHELSHYLAAELLGVRTGQLTLLPSLTPNSSSHYTLGSLKTAHTGPFRGFLIGIAPFLSGLAILYYAMAFLELSWATAPWWQLLILIYLVIVISSSMLISREDRRFWPPVIIFLLILYLAISSLFPAATSTLPLLLNPLLTRLNMVLMLTISLNLGMISLSMGLRYLVEYITGKRVKIKRRTL